MSMRGMLAVALLLASCGDDAPKRPGIGVELWTVVGGTHIPNATTTFPNLALAVAVGAPRALTGQNRPTATNPGAT